METIDVIKKALKDNGAVDEDKPSFFGGPEKIEKNDFWGWYIAGGEKDSYDLKLLAGPYSKRKAKKLEGVYSRVYKEKEFMTISGSSALRDLVEKAEHEAGWYK